ncbi:hypothetical protein [Actinosynnema sp. NPDC020468]|uniref:hypothetical protein n=1 Tax=Actinosynnema sp. NPDC020468 TaxID=3154488 RepID=UPI0033CCD2D1
MRRALGLALVVGALLGPTAPAAHAADCSGVTVVVDYRSLGGGVQTGCAAGDPATGLAAMQAAGFGYTFASRQPGFVCRINAKPAADPCVNASPATAYWSYWHAPPGGSWSYSDLGAGSYDPPAGSVEGWAFGSGEQPGIAPPAPPRPTQPAPQPTQPKPTPQQPGQPALTAPGQPGQPAQPGQPGQPAATTTTTAVTTTGSSVALSSTSASAQSSGSSAASESSVSSSAAGPSATSVAVEPTATRGSPVGLVVGLAVIAVLGGVAFLVARRRKAAG